MTRTPKKETSAEDKEKDLRTLQTEEIGGEETPLEEDLDASDTDDDEDEGVGDGRLGRTTPDILEK
jgi:hypothetical protein